jgi:hypothetical protein
MVEWSAHRTRVCRHGSIIRCAGKLVVLAVLAVAMAGCAGSSESGNAASVTGNEQGGKVPYSEGGMPAAMDAAKAHCSQFGKKAQIIQMSPAAEGGGTIGFQCR